MCTIMGLYSTNTFLFQIFFFFSFLLNCRIFSMLGFIIQLCISCLFPYICMFFHELTVLVIRLLRSNSKVELSLEEYKFLVFALLLILLRLGFCLGLLKTRFKTWTIYVGFCCILRLIYIFWYLRFLVIFHFNFWDFNSRKYSRVEIMT